MNEIMDNVVSINLPLALATFAKLSMSNLKTKNTNIPHRARLSGHLPNYMYSVELRNVFITAA